MKPRVMRTPEQKKEIIAKVDAYKTANDCSVQKACDETGTNHTQYYEWKSQLFGAKKKSGRPKGSKNKRKYTKRKTIEHNLIAIPGARVNPNDPNAIIFDEHSAGHMDPTTVNKALDLMRSQNLIISQLLSPRGN